MKKQCRHPNGEVRRPQGGALQDAWSSVFRIEARVLLGAMTPRCPVWVFLSDHDRENQLFPIERLLPDLRRQIHAVVGGDTTITCNQWNRPAMLPGDGRYVAPNGTTMREHTIICIVCLPADLNGEQRERLLQIFIEFGLMTNQEVIQVVAGITTCWLPTGELLDTLARGQNTGMGVRFRSGRTTESKGGKNA